MLFSEVRISDPTFLLHQLAKNVDDGIVGINCRPVFVIGDDLLLLLLALQLLDALLSKFDLTIVGETL